MGQGTKYKSASLYKARRGEIFPAEDGKDADYLLTMMTEDRTLQVNSRLAGTSSIRLEY